MNNLSCQLNVFILQFGDRVLFTIKADYSFFIALPSVLLYGTKHEPISHRLSVLKYPRKLFNAPSLICGDSTCQTRKCKGYRECVPKTALHSESSCHYAFSISRLYKTASCFFPHFFAHSVSHDWCLRLHPSQWKWNKHPVFLRFQTRFKVEMLKSMSERSNQISVTEAHTWQRVRKAQLSKGISWKCATSLERVLASHGQIQRSRGRREEKHGWEASRTTKSCQNTKNG